MSLNETLEQLEVDLHAGKVSERRAAVQHAAQLLKQVTCREPCRQRIVTLLRDVVANELFASVGDAAQAVLDNLEQSYDPMWRPDERAHMVGVSCTAGHVTYFDKRDLCNESSDFKRSRERSGDQELDYVYVRCGEQGCANEVKIQIDCGAYR